LACNDGVSLRRKMKATSRSAPVELVWNDVSYTIPTKKGGQRKILDNVSGRLEPASLLAIMGPSGSGKSSLLNTLAGRVPITSGAKLEGEILINGNRPVSEMPLISAYVEQDEALFHLSTVRETFTFAARLRLPPSMSRAEQEKRVEEVIAELGLVNCANTLVGNQRVRGVSGGERKRVNIGVELLNNPPLVFLDEPTSGLDSFQAQSVMQTLKSLATAGRTVVASVHQPRSSIYAMLDGLMLLANGRVAYAGIAGADSTSYFTAAGYPIPEGFNPADHFLDVICVDRRDEQSDKESTARVEKILASWEGSAAGRAAAAGKSSAVGQERSTLRELASMHGLDRMDSLSRFAVSTVLLTRRTWRELTRDKGALLFQWGMNLFFALIFGLVYLRMDEGQTSLQNRTGILFFMAMNQAFGSAIDTATVIPQQLQVVTRERAARMYDVLPFYLATFSCTLLLTTPVQLFNSSVVYWMVNLRPEASAFFTYFGVMLLASQCAVAVGMFLSAAIKSVEAAPKIAPAVVVLLLMFSGYFLNVESIPVWLIWLKYVSFIGWTFQANCINEFAGRTFDCPAEPGPPCLDGDQWLQNLNFEGGSIGLRCVWLLLIAFCFHGLAYVILLLRSPKFLPMRPNKGSPSPGSIEVTEAPTTSTTMA